MPHFNSSLFERVLAFELQDAARPVGEGHCCERMGLSVTYECEECEDVWECGDALIYYSYIFDEYGLIVHDGGSSYVLLRHCPWCGARLPGSRRDEWFDALEALGFDDPLDQEIPGEFRGREWYSRAGT